MKSKFDFTTMPDRAGKDAIAVEMIPVPGVKVRDGVSRLPMWVADMNFATAPAITEAIAARNEHPLFGYYMPTKEYYDSIIDWQRRRNGVEGLTKKSIGYENGVLGCVSSAIQSLTLPGDAVMLHSPTYIGFTHVLDDIGRKAVHSKLVRDENGVWRMDYEDMDRVIRENHCRMAVFCSPHNPCGRVWEKEEIEKAMDIFRKNDCIVISDEIWSDLIMDGYKHIPTQSVSEDAKQRTIAVYAPSKTFNLAGLIGSYHIIYNKEIREKVRRFSGMSHYNNMNVLSMHALIGAYSEQGEEWVDALLEVLKRNIDFACDFIEKHFDGVSVFRPEGTYMLFLDFTRFCDWRSCSLDDVLRRGIEEGVIWQDGRDFFGEHSIRMNLALPEAAVQEAFERLKNAIFDAEFQ